MQVIRTSVLVNAPIGFVFDLARDVELHARGLAHTRERAVPPGRTDGLLDAGDLLSLRARHYRLPWRYDARVVVCERPHRLVDVQERGPWRSMRHEQRFTPTGAGTLVTEELCWRSPAGPLGSVADALLLRRHLRRLLLVRDAHLCMVAEQLAGSGPASAGRADPPSPTVVGVVLVDRRGRVLAAQRFDGGWEFPGGKVEPGESEPDAAIRECQEELGVTVALDGPLDGAEPIAGSDYLLRLWMGRIVQGEPTARVHARLRWLPAAELAGPPSRSGRSGEAELSGVDKLDWADWLPADRPFLPRIAERVSRSAAG